MRNLGTLVTSVTATTIKIWLKKLLSSCYSSKIMSNWRNCVAVTPLLPIPAYSLDYSLWESIFREDLFLYNCLQGRGGRARAVRAGPDHAGGQGRLLRLQQQALRAARRQKGHAGRQQGQQGERLIS